MKENNKTKKQNWTEPIKEKWIENEITDEAIDYANRFGRYLKNQGLTTSQIRNFFSEVKRIQLQGYKKNISQFKLLKAKLAYAVGRESSVSKRNVLKDFKNVFEQAHNYVQDEISFDNFVSFLEAILAFHKYYGGK